MAGRMSNRDRIARMAAEKEAEAKQKKAKKKAPAKKKTAAKKKTTKAASSRSAGRMRLVWAVCDQSGSPVKQYNYPERDEADKEAARLTASKGKLHFVRKEKVPMESE